MFYYTNFIQETNTWWLRRVRPLWLGAWGVWASEGITEGTAASDGFLEAIDPATTPERKTELEAQLRRYCSFDTEAMVAIVYFFEKSGVEVSR